MVPKIAGAFGAIRRGIHLAQAAYPQRLKRVHVVGAPPYLVSPLQLMRSIVNEKVRRRVRADSVSNDTQILRACMCTCVIILLSQFYMCNELFL